jgi:hypothetical protein
MHFPRPIMRPTGRAMPTPVLPVPKPQFPVRSPTSRGPMVGGNLAKRTSYRPLSGLGSWGMGALGDTEAGSTAAANFRSYLVNHIAAKAGPAIGSAAQQTPSLAACINFCASLWQQAQNMALPPAEQTAWNQWSAAAADPNSPYNIYWMFGQLISDAQSDLITAANAYESNMWLDSAASAAEFTLMDTTSSGTTWYGGATVTSLLNNSQWSTIFAEAFTVMQKGVAYGTLPLTYLEIVCRAMLQAPNDRRFPYFQAPGATSATDPAGIAFRCALKQLGWSTVVKDWFADTNQGWAGANAQLEAQDKAYGEVITVLDYTSGAIILQQVQDKVAEYFQARTSAVLALQGYQQMASSGAQIDPQTQTSMAALMNNFAATDQQAYTAINSIGMWSAGPAGQLNGLGLATLIIAGVIAITLLGIIAFVVDQMTATGRAAADQTAAISKSVLASVKITQKSCQQVWDASAQTQADQTALQACMGTSNKLLAAIPPPTPASTDPLGFKSMAIFGVVAIAGIVGLYLIKKKFSGGGSSAATEPAPG